MEHVIGYRDTGKVIFRVLGICALALFLVSNPIVLRHRFWTAEVVTRLVAEEFTVLVTGIGLLALRKWSAVLASFLAVYVAIGMGDSTALRVILLTPLLVTVVFWASLRSVLNRRDAIYVIAAISISGVVEYVAYLRRLV